MFAAGLVGFGICSLLCAVAPSSDFLIGARAVQGVFGAMLVPSTLALIMDRFPENERPAAIGSWTAWTGIATVIGPLGGGALVQLASWRLHLRHQRGACRDHAVAAQPPGRRSS